MTQPNTEQAITEINAPNLVDRAANSADKVLEATRQVADSVIDDIADKVHAVRDRASPALDRFTAPVDSLIVRTQAAPLRSLLMAAATGAALVALIGMIRSGR